MMFPQTDAVKTRATIGLSFHRLLTPNGVATFGRIQKT
jgi:hypothetical protein